MAVSLAPVGGLWHGRTGRCRGDWRRIVHPVRYRLARGDLCGGDRFAGRAGWRCRMPCRYDRRFDDGEPATGEAMPATGGRWGFADGGMFCFHRFCRRFAGNDAVMSKMAREACNMTEDRGRCGRKVSCRSSVPLFREDGVYPRFLWTSLSASGIFPLQSGKCRVCRQNGQKGRMA